MKILHISNHILNVGNGIVNVLIDLACTQADSGHILAVASSGGQYESLLQEFCIQHFYLDQKRTPSNILSMSLAYQKIIQEFQPDIVHVHMMTGAILSKTFKFGSHYKIVSTVHNEFQRSSILMGLADCVIAVSDAVATSMKQRGISAKKIHVVRNGTLGSPRTRPINQYEPIQIHRPSITTVAGMYQRKGIHELIQAFIQIAHQFPSAHLYLVGDGPDRTTFEEEANQSPFADRIHFEKFQPEPQRYLRSTDIFVLASHKDPSPLVIPEAREAGCAIIASHVDGIPEALDHGQAGYLVPPQSINKLAQALTELLNDEQKLNAQKKQAQMNLDYLNVSRVHNETMAVYQKALA
jgi:glycosyltransferase involved in cell wall biosynthesis